MLWLAFLALGLTEAQVRVQTLISPSTITLYP